MRTAWRRVLLDHRLVLTLPLFHMHGLGGGVDMDVVDGSEHGDRVRVPDLFHLVAADR